MLASLGFGLAESVALLLLIRGLQGLGFALSTIAGLGLLIESSPDLTADIARQEVLVGLSMVLAPAAGGLCTRLQALRPSSTSLPPGSCSLCWD